MLSTILVPLDGSRLAEQALPFGERFARAAAARLVLVRVVNADADSRAAAAPGARDYLDQVASRLRSNGLLCDTLVPTGDAAVEIEGALVVSGADLVIMATHGRSGIGRMLYGSVADAVLRQTSVPVLLVPPAVNLPWPADRQLRIVVPLDGSERSEAVLSPAVELTGYLGGELLLMQVVQWPPVLYADGSELLAYDVEEQLADARTYLDAVAARLRVTGTNARVRAEIAPQPMSAIANLAQQEQADMIAMATHGRSGLARVVLGSVTTGTLQRASVPLLVVRPSPLGATMGQMAPAKGTSMVAALPAQSTPMPAAPTKAAAAPDPVPSVGIRLTLNDLQLLERGIGELVYKPGGNPDLAPELRDLDARLRRAESLHLPADGDTRIDPLSIVRPPSVQPHTEATGASS
jgi:nucleotide-binding universal stress UspA family protein